MLLIDPDEPSPSFLQINRIKAKRYRKFRRSLGVWAQVRHPVRARQGRAAIMLTS
jgi:hypothetical protein